MIEKISFLDLVLYSTPPVQTGSVAILGMRPIRMPSIIEFSSSTATESD